MHREPPGRRHGCQPRPPRRLRRGHGGHRPGLNDAPAGLPDLLQGWNAGTGPFGGRVDTEIDELSHLDLWVGRIARAFRDADRICSTDGCPPVLFASGSPSTPPGPPASPPRWPGGEHGHLFVVERDGADGRTRVVRLTVDTLPEGMSALEWQLVVEEMGLTGTDGPLHAVVHGWGATSDGATGVGLATADLYDQQGVEGATVLVVDWDAGDGAGGIGTPWDFDDAEGSARATGDALAPPAHRHRPVRPGRRGERDRPQPGQPRGQPDALADGGPVVPVLGGLRDGAAGHPRRRRHRRPRALRRTRRPKGARPHHHDQRR